MYLLGVGIKASSPGHMRGKRAVIVLCDWRVPYGTCTYPSLEGTCSQGADGGVTVGAHAPDSPCFS